MITCSAWSGKRFAVLGLARSGLAAAESLLASGAEVIAWDRQDVARAKLEGRATLADPMESDLTGCAGIVVSPGVPLNTHPIVGRAAQFGVPVIGDIELFAQARAELPPHKVVGITGTNGKSTTTALVHHIVKTASVPTTMGGNIGLPILAQDPLPADGVYVLELSSYQIDLTQTLDCDVAVLLNVTPDHLDRYDGFGAYRASKVRLLQMQSWDRRAIVASGANGVDEAVMALTDGAELTQWFGGDYQTDFAAEQAGWPALQGPHNAQNAWAARMACLALGLTSTQINCGLASYAGLPHRMERVATHNGVLFVNDSKATNTDSAAPALAAFPPEANGPRIHWIVGGLPKEDGLGATQAHLANVKCAYTIGEAGPRFAELLEAAGVPVERSEMLQEATRRAVAAARPGEIVLLSPACASFDQFRDFEVRGAHFRDIVEALTGGEEGQA
ncbi:MAG: UDP-N-acetylmuramoyl-L-alanine--D-glutamate ligase [Sphingomonadaceae bacterium]|nr:UDP-N-acetylmuramoyl-L-alanine--D-glutamate ligase [Sphingomonadaceae bacterium]